MTEVLCCSLLVMCIHSTCQPTSNGGLTEDTFTVGECTAIFLCVFHIPFYLPIQVFLLFDFSATIIP
jgi:hypothetical protein